MRKFGIVAATSVEMENVLNALGGVDKLEDTGGHEVYHVSRGKNKLFVVVSGAGEIASAAATQLLITKYEVEAILNFGFVGALDSTLKCQQVVIVKDVVHYDFDTSAIDDVTVGQYEGCEDCYFSTDKQLLALAENAFPELRPVRIASGDKFIADSEKKDWLIQTFHADICDMESAGIVLTASRNNVPTLCIKVVSDNADENSPASYIDIVYNNSRKCAGMLAALLDETSSKKKPQKERQKAQKQPKNKKSKKKV
jgi:5''-methylthioadenosine/S-adenosylhomocysteine nucleosidase